MTRQLLRHYQPIGIAAVVIGAFSLVPGFPKIPFMLISGACGFFAYRSYRTAKASQPETIKPEAKPEEGESDVGISFAEQMLLYGDQTIDDVPEACIGCPALQSCNRVIRRRVEAKRRRRK